MKKYRKILIHKLFDLSMVLYCKFKKKKAWNINVATLLTMPADTFGYHLGEFLKENNFELIPKVERHDAYHVLTGYGTCVEDEIALQYACFGNGKRTPYLYGVLLLGTLLLPDYLKYYLKAYKYGKEANTFHHFDYLKILPLNMEKFKAMIFTKSNTAHQIINSKKLNPFNL